MSNSIVNFHQTATSVAELDAALAKGREHAPESKANNNRPFLRLDSGGDGWVYGMDSTAVEEGSRWAINPFSLRSGWVCWADGNINGKREKLGEVMDSIATPPAMPETDHSAKGGEWTEQVGFDLICIDGVDEGVELSYNVNSKGGQGAFADVYKAMMERPDGDYCFPIVELCQDCYINKKWGKKKIYVPEFKIVDWADMEQNLLTDSKGDKPALEQPKRRRRAA